MSLKNPVLVYVKNCDTSNIFKPALFQICIFNQIGLTDTKVSKVYTQCFLKENRLHLCANVEKLKGVYKKETDDSEENHITQDLGSYLLTHPSFCPVLNLPQEDALQYCSEGSPQGIHVGVATLLEDTDGKVLLTRRASHMRTFPGVWVPPGGHIELNETLEQAGLRELEEETGVSLSPEEITSSSILGLWESVFPPVLTFGLPKRHHIVVYRHVLVNLTSNEVKARIKMDPSEVDGCMMLTSFICSYILDDDPSDKHIEKVSIMSLNEGGGSIESFVDISKLKIQIPEPGGGERISTGTRYSLELWLEKKRNVKSQL